MTFTSWYHRHETELCLCGHQRREHPLEPSMLPGTPGCLGTCDYAADCECPRFRFAVEVPAGPDDLEEKLAAYDAFDAVAVRVCPNCGHRLDLHLGGYCYHLNVAEECDCLCETTIPTGHPPWLPVPEYHVFREQRSQVASHRRFLLRTVIEPEAATRCGFSVGGALADDLEPDIMAWQAEIEADRELFIAAMLREGLD